MYNFKPDFYADVRTEDRFTTTLTYVDGRKKESRVRVEKRAFIRVFDGKIWYYASTTDLDDIQKNLDRLYALAKSNPKIGSNKTVRRFEVNSDVRMQFAPVSVRNVPFEKKDELIRSYLKEIERFKGSMPVGMYLDRNSVFEFSSSKGAYIKYDYQTCGVVLSCTFLSGSDFFKAHYQAGETEFDKLLGRKAAIKRVFSEQRDYAARAKEVTPGNYPVILSPEAAGVFAHESFGHKSEADFMLADEGIAKEWTIGKTVASPLLSIVDSGKEKGCGYCPYDDEGTHARKNYLIKNGVLAGRLHDGETATYLKEKLTGNARAIDCRFEPIVRMTTTYIEKGNLTKEELFAGVKHGYFVESIKHGSGMSKFTLAPHVAYEIVDGKIGDPVKISVITGDVFTTLGLIDGLSDKVELLSFVTGGCGKMEQQGLPVGFGGPYVRVSEMFVQ